MINLLPDEIKNQLRAARINTALIKCILIVIIGAAFLGGAILFTNKDNTGSGIANQQSIDNQYNDYDQQAQSLDAKVSDAKSVISNQIDYSEILTALADSLPDTVSLDSVSLSSTNINSGTAIEINAHGSKKFIASSMNSDPGFSSKHPNIFSDYKFISSEKDSKDGTTSIKFSLKINYSKGL